jgi:hypothetical protein
LQNQSDTELLLCVCRLDKVVLLVHCCVLQISCIQGTPPYPVSSRKLGVSQFQPWMLIVLTRTQLVLLSISNLLGAVLCLSRLCLPQGLEPTAKPPAKPAPKAAKPQLPQKPQFCTLRISVCFLLLMYTGVQVPAATHQWLTPGLFPIVNVHRCAGGSGDTPMAHTKMCEDQMNCAVHHVSEGQGEDAGQHARWEHATAKPRAPRMILSQSPDQILDRFLYYCCIYSCLSFGLRLAMNALMPVVRPL